MVSSTGYTPGQAYGPRSPSRGPMFFIDGCAKYGVLVVLRSGDEDMYSTENPRVITGDPNFISNLL